MSNNTLTRRGRISRIENRTVSCQLIIDNLVPSLGGIAWTFDIIRVLRIAISDTKCFTSIHIIGTWAFWAILHVHFLAYICHQFGYSINSLTSIVWRIGGLHGIPIKCFRPFVIIHNLSRRSSHTTSRTVHARLNRAIIIIGSILIPLGLNQRRNICMRRYGSTCFNATVYCMIISLEHSLHSRRSCLGIIAILQAICQYRRQFVICTNNHKTAITIKHIYTSAIAIGNACYSAG